MPHWFFTSYARVDRDSYMETFFEDLRDAVRSIVGGAPEDISFIDTKNIELGEEWDTSTYCGKEYQVFLDRHESLSHARLQHRVIFPVLWVRPLVDFPNVISRFQLSHDDLPGIYAQEGLQYMMRLSSHKDDYNRLVLNLARKIVDAGREVEVPNSCSLRPLNEITNVFHSSTSSSGFGRPAAGVPYSVRFAFVVARRGELTQLRSSLEGYHEESGWHWRPYHPHVDAAAVGQLAQEIASRLKLRYLELEAGPNLVNRIRELEGAHEIVVVITDAWTIRLHSYADALRMYDQATLANSAVLVPWNDSDPETGAQLQTLKDALQGVFPRKTQFCPPGHHWHTIRSEKDLKDKLEMTLAEVRSIVLSFLEAKRKAESSQLQDVAIQKGIRLAAKPQLTGPGGHSQ